MEPLIKPEKKKSYLSRPLLLGLVGLVVLFGLSGLCFVILHQLRLNTEIQDANLSSRTVPELDDTLKPLKNSSYHEVKNSKLPSRIVPELDDNLKLLKNNSYHEIKNINSSSGVIPTLVNLKLLKNISCHEIKNVNPSSGAIPNLDNLKLLKNISYHEIKNVNSSSRAIPELDDNLKLYQLSRNKDLNLNSSSRSVPNLDDNLKRLELNVIHQIKDEENNTGCYVESTTEFLEQDNVTSEIEKELHEIEVEIQDELKHPPHWEFDLDTMKMKQFKWGENPKPLPLDQFPKWTQEDENLVQDANNKFSSPFMNQNINFENPSILLDKPFVPPSLSENNYMENEHFVFEAI